MLLSNMKKIIPIMILSTILPTSAVLLNEPFLTREVKLWLEGETDLPQRCQNKDPDLENGHKVPFIKFGRCEDMPGNCDNIPYGQMDADGRLDGPSELVIHWTDGDSPDLKPEDDEESPDTFCYSVSVPLSIRAVRGHFNRGVPQGRVTIEHRNGEETVGNSEDGVLQGITVTKSREGGILYIGRYRLGMPDGWGWAFSPGDTAAHGMVAFRADGGVISVGEVVYLDRERNKTLVGRYSEQSGTLSVYTEEEVLVGERDCLAEISIPQCGSQTEIGKIELPFLVKIVNSRVRVALKYLVVYNRVPKTGSQSLLYLLRDLSLETDSFKVYFPPTR